jgi:hypothetical protein
MKNTRDNEGICTHLCADSNLANDRVCQKYGVALRRKYSKQTLNGDSEERKTKDVQNLLFRQHGMGKSTDRVPQYAQINLTARRKCTKFVVSSAGRWKIERSSSSTRPDFDCPIEQSRARSVR